MSLPQPSLSLFLWLSTFGSVCTCVFVYGQTHITASSTPGAQESAMLTMIERMRDEKDASKQFICVKHIVHTILL